MRTQEFLKFSHQKPTTRKHPTPTEGAQPQILSGAVHAFRDGLRERGLEPRCLQLVCGGARATATGLRLKAKGHRVDAVSRVCSVHRVYRIVGLIGLWGL